MTDAMTTDDVSTPRRPADRRLGVAAVAILAFAAGGVIGGYLHFGAWHANAAMLSALSFKSSTTRIRRASALTGADVEVGGAGGEVGEVGGDVVVAVIVGFGACRQGMQNMGM